MSKLETVPVSGATRILVRRVELSVRTGPDKGHSAPLAQGPLVIGTDAACDLVLTDPTVSARHAELVRQGEEIVLRDLGSTNGVFLNDVRVREACPEIGARIRLGKTTLALKAAGEDEVLLAQTDHFGSLYGTSRVMRALFVSLETLAQSDAPLLIEGETGTGKELTAEAVHGAGPRADKPFVIFDCGAVSDSLLEAELFGYEKGAFTGALASHEGLAEAAAGGTFVIDEVGELPSDLQPKLLRLIERREVRRIGTTTPRPVDVRVIACTHRSLLSEVQAGRFREDLYYRLSALKVRLPALRERPEDIPGLVDRLLVERGSRLRFADLPEGDQAMLLAHRWPGNVRELRNAVERLLAFPGSSAPDLLGGQDLPNPDAALTDLPLSTARAAAQDAFERRYLTEMMKRADESISEAARQAGVSRQFLQRILRKHGMR